MKRILASVFGIVMAVGFPAVWAQQGDLEVTLEVVPVDASAGAATSEIVLPAEAAPEGHENSAFGLETANKARQLNDQLGEQFGKDTTDAARERAQDRMPNITIPGQ